MEQRRKKKRSRKVLKVILIIVLLLVVIRIALPFVILRYANNTLSTMKNYRGRIQDIDLALIRGAYKIDSIYINQRDTTSGKETPFFSAREIDLSVEWRSLLKGAVAGELVFRRPQLIFTKDRVEPQNVKKDSTDFKDLLEGLMPLKVNRFEVIDGYVHYVDKTSKPNVDVSISSADIVATNLRNAYDSAESVLPATIQGNAEVYDGTLEMFIKLNPLADVPTFDLTATLENTNLVKLNDFFAAYAKIDINKGTLGLYTEVAAKEGNFEGYVKPLLRDLDVLGKEDRDDNVFKKIWEGFVGGTGQIIENLKKDQVATKIPFKGKIEDPKANIWYTIVNVMENAFIRAIQPSIDQEISISTVDDGSQDKKSFIEKVFDGKDEKKDQGKDEKRDEKKKKDGK